MKIQGSGSSSRTDAARRSKSAGGAQGASSGFADSLKSVEGADTAGPTAAAEATGGVAAVDALLAVQGATVVGDAPDRDARERQARYGFTLLDRLEKIRTGLLAGRIAKDDLAALAQEMRAKRESNLDPALAPLLDEIELRAQVELAKLTRRPV